ncbi:hypothetical protein COB55_01900 [Candidatus Wolfebacteria bacterium]|nr:MAG: hypothetical protein COB55_01900 [Candidatus Wolfebacteria bacterium]
MGKGKKSFFERLTGSVSMEEYDDIIDDVAPPTRGRRPAPAAVEPEEEEYEEEVAEEEEFEEESGDGQLTVDVYQTPADIIIKTMVAGVHPSDLDVSITRDMVTIRGKREEARSIKEADYFHKELYWGSFSRTILLPQEIEVEEAEAVEKHGLLILKLPKIDKARQTKLKIKSDR